MVTNKGCQVFGLEVMEFQHRKVFIKKNCCYFFLKLQFTFTICKYPLIHLVFTEKHREVFANLLMNYVNSLI